MTAAAKKTSKKIDANMFDDVPVLQRKWQAALRPGEKLPRYEDIMLGSLGRLADHIVLIKDNQGTLELSRSGQLAKCARPPRIAQMKRKRRAKARVRRD